MRELDDLGERFWAWRARQQPRTRDDIPRLDRPPGWLPEVDAALADRRREELARVRRPSWPASTRTRCPTASTTGCCARRSARVSVGERHPAGAGHPQVLDRPGARAGLRRPAAARRRRGPDRGGDRGCCAPSRPPCRTRRRALVQPAREFAGLAVAELDGIAGRIDACAEALARIDPVRRGRSSPRPRAEAGAALEQFGAGLADRARRTCRRPSRSGGSTYEWFLREVACVPLTVERDRGHRPPRVRAGGLARAAARHPQPRRAGAAAARRRGPAGPRAGARRGGGAPVLRRPGPAEPAGVAAALPHPAHARLPGAAGLPRRRRRADRAGPAHRGRRRATCRRPARTCRTSTPPTPATRAPGSCTRARTTSSSPWPGGTRGRSAGTTTTPAPTRASPSTTRR